LTNNNGFRQTLKRNEEKIKQKRQQKLNFKRKEMNKDLSEKQYNKGMRLHHLEFHCHSYVRKMEKVII